jgi:hypothetical protein
MVSLFRKPKISLPIIKAAFPESLEKHRALRLKTKKIILRGLTAKGYDQKLASF